ncbi:ABC transporter ATP-binding protein [Caldisalinibacter kiritimatiensis]|uniref:Vitamin B12 ABC transporter, ATPase component BtuD n=1 Tax=Caldisalinibacter kiritimatiensis TaxID=1304284 RepID=R1ATF6_9FIRM|nr:ABC transporter ATP-binding protein [Caldisalinibacter kiritimatiensis]EOC99911.1 Vitamin B12 ABC transporter, ATPase component BtuD [Caldisalinibacter kiritimatiensis]
MAETIKIESLDFGYGDKLILKGINLDIEKGDFVSIIGPNGSGKSTLLKNITSILKPNSGSVKIDGVDVKNYRPKELAKKLGFVPQDTNIAYDFTVFDVVLMGRSPYLGRFEREKQIDYEITTNALKATDTIGFSDKSIKEISGGERQRVIIARALAQQPEILLLDEPTSHLDINHQMEILYLLQKLNKEQNMTMVVVLHDIDLAARFSNKIVLLKEGQILSIGTPNEVITKENMEEAYKIKMVINENPFSNSLFVTPLPPKKDTVEKKEKIHVICGGGSGGDIISKLDMNGYKVSMGVINIGDSDWELGKRLSLKMIEEMPFSPISKKAYEKNTKVVKDADILVLASVPYGRGNMQNLELAFEELQSGKKVYLVDNYSQYDEYDYVDGKAKELIVMMKERGLKVVKSTEELLNVL